MLLLLNNIESFFSSFEYIFMHMYTDSGGDDDDGSPDDGCGGDCGGNDNGYDDGVFAIDLCLCRI